jgi:type IV secretory pathway VirB10-like protein
MPRLQHAFVALALLGCTSAALAQYVWLNEKGVKQYSDVPPPASVPSSRILKAPGGVPRADNAAEANDAAVDAKQAKPETKSLAEQNADFEKRRREQAEKDKKAAEQAKQAAVRQKNCETARDYNRALSSGQRISRVNAAGERVYISDEERAREERDTQRALADCK